jgi:hypothetical protein
MLCLHNPAHAHNARPRLFLQFRGWDRLRKRFEARETPDNLFFEAGEEEWIEEEKEVAVLSEEEVLDEDDAADSSSLRR